MVAATEMLRGTMAKGSLQIHSENILPIIKKWLYSERDIFVRELVSNGRDAIQKVKILRDRGELDVRDDEFRIDVTINPEKKTLTFTDNGIGMTAEEVKKYIAQIAFSGAEEFLKKYSSEQEKDQMIGHFGLGFYSSYMVANKVSIETRSYHPDAAPVAWECDGSSDYEISDGSRSARGTDVILHISDDHHECLDKAYVERILKQYCSFLPYPIYLDGKQVNEHFPLWVKSPTECSQEEYLAFYRYLYPTDEDPLFWVHLNVDYPFHLKGILYFPKVRRDFDPTKQNVHLYCNRVFVSDHCKEIIPQYLSVLKGVIDSPDIPLNVSRSYLQMDRTVRQLSNHISKKVVDSLAALYRNDKPRFLKGWQDVSFVVKMGILEDNSLYEKTKDFLVWKNGAGEWTTLPDYLERNNEKNNNKILYTTDEHPNNPIFKMYQNRGFEVLSMNHPLDAYLLHVLEEKITPASLQRIDAAVDSLIDQERESSVVDAEGKTGAEKLAEFIKEQLQDANVEVEAKSLANDTVPSLLKIDEKQRRMRDYMMRLQHEGGSEMHRMLATPTLVVNTNHSLIQAVAQLKNSDLALAKELVHHLYDLALLSQKEMTQENLPGFVERNNHLLETLTGALLRAHQEPRA